MPLMTFFFNFICKSVFKSLFCIWILYLMRLLFLSICTKVWKFKKGFNANRWSGFCYILNAVLACTLHSVSSLQIWKSHDFTTNVLKGRKLWRHENFCSRLVNEKKYWNFSLMYFPDYSRFNVNTLNGTEVAQKINNTKYKKMHEKQQEFWK